MPLSILARLYDALTVALLALAGGAMLGVLLINIGLRYLFDAGLIWSEEIARYLMVWSTMIGLGVAYRARAHISIALLPDLIPVRVAILLNLLCHGLALSAAFMLWQSGEALIRLLGHIEGPSSGLPMGFVYAAVPAGAVLVAIEAIRQATADLRRLITPGRPT